MNVQPIGAPMPSRKPEQQYMVDFFFMVSELPCHFSAETLSSMAWWISSRTLSASSLL
jgi:hypothetical protein